ncbi:MAG TPA: CPBP family intramembrane glutamic endopeptidase [Longimicrobiales bacterium]
MTSRSKGLRIAAVALAAAAVWFWADALAWPARVLVVVLIVLLPPLAAGEATRAELGMPSVPRLRVYLTSAVVLAVLAALALVAGLLGGLGVRGLGLAPLALSALLRWTAALLAVMLLLVWLWRKAGARESPTLRQLLPRTTGERLGFLILALAAGAGEELVFRGFLPAALVMAGAPTALAVGVAAIVFGLLHAYQRRAGMLRATILGLLLTVPLLATGSLFPSIAAHVLYDAVAGMWMGRRGRPGLGLGLGLGLGRAREGVRWWGGRPGGDWELDGNGRERERERERLRLRNRRLCGADGSGSGNVRGIGIAGQRSRARAPARARARHRHSRAPCGARVFGVRSVPWSSRCCFRVSRRRCRPSRCSSSGAMSSSGSWRRGGR